MNGQPLDSYTLLSQIPQAVWVIAAYVVLKNFTTLGSIINKIVEYKTLTEDVSKLKTTVEVLKKDLDAAHSKIRDLEVETEHG